MRKKMMGGGMMQRPMYKHGGKGKKSESKIITISVGVGKGKDYPGIKKIMEMNKKGKKRFSDGGSALKEVPTRNKGLKKLPTEVRNKMGFMKKGGVVSDTKKKQFKANQAGQKATNKKAMKVAKGVLKLTPAGFGIAAADTVKRIKKMGCGMMKRPMYKDGSPKTLLRRIGPEESKRMAQDPSRKKRMNDMMLRYPKGKPVDPETREKLKKLLDSKKPKTMRKKMMGGGSLKSVDPKTQKGLSKLPTKVRNKMGFMKKGGKVK